MYKRIVAVFGILMLMVAMLPVSNVLAYTPIFRGLYVNTSHEGLRALVSTGSANGSPPNFAFSAFSPDTVDQVWQFRILPQASCINAGTEFERYPGASTGRVFYVENTCTGNRLTQTSLSDATFRSKYVRTNTWNDTGTAFQDETYDLRVFKISTVPVWQVQIYNYNTSSYDFVINVTGAGTTTNGSIEFTDSGGTQQATGQYCPTLYAWSIVQMRGLQRYTYSSGTWTTLSSGDVSYYNDTAYCFTNNVYKVTTPHPYQWKLLPYGATY